MFSVKTSYVSKPHVNTNETLAADTQKITIKDSKYMPQKVFKSQRKTARDWRTYKTVRKQSMVRPYLQVIKGKWINRIAEWI